MLLDAFKIFNFYTSYSEYQIGVEVKRGRGKLSNSRIVTFVTRYQLENTTQYKIAYLQRHQLKEEVLTTVYLNTLFLYAHVNSVIGQLVRNFVYTGVLEVDNCDVFHGQIYS